ncbi:DUF3347 domain-containing protein [Ferruginibacter lapsinanis]|uniref:DUF3347 domain-containing protein n=1 Tax=Ferruginibacter lapsinanis TaxID=563172 RepID=UPI001E3B8043|nr:DUF3347 domain-containing protein [Ferruginibacter lapsinanis]UEG48927.1 DUF3347 domain-containing protein [Ferruginibacter lapsinanis]
MKKILLILLVLLVAFAVYWFKFRDNDKNKGPKQEPLKVSRHSDGFNKSVDTMLTAYFEMHDAFVNGDTAKAKAACKNLIALADNVKLDELKTDTATVFEAGSMQMKDIVANAQSLLQQKDITEMRQDFRMVGENIYPLLKTIHYEGKTLYWQNCPMAFGEDKGANWISNTKEIVNPYLGKNHPEFKSSMLHCGEIEDSIKAQ